jgi:hypothetical protein
MLSTETAQLLNQLAPHARQHTPQQFLRHAYDRLSVTLQSSNADISQMRMQQLHLAQHVHGMQQHLAGNQHRIRSGQFVAHDHRYHQPRRDSDWHEARLHSTIQAKEADDREQSTMEEPAFEYDGQIAFADFVMPSTIAA